MRYYSENPYLQINLKSHEEQEITIEELVDRYYKDPENYFDLSYNDYSNSPPEDPSASSSINNSNFIYQ